jgi:hypothetical protein
MKQTAVEWLHEMLRDSSKEIFDGNIWEQAKAMEKEQIIKAFNQSWHDRMNPYKTAEKYYNKTFKSE